MLRIRTGSRAEFGTKRSEIEPTALAPLSGHNAEALRSDAAGRHVVRYDGTPGKRHAFAERLRLAGLIVDTQGTTG
jgi:hypothetical protein